MEQFERLSFEEQKKAIEASNVSGKGELILNSRQPEILIRDLSYEELFLIYKKTDSETLPDLIRCLDLEQMLFVSDMECWKKDTFAPEKFLNWLDNLLEADIENLSNWLLKSEIEILILGFQQYIQVIKYLSFEDTLETVLPPDKPYFSLDGFYYIAVIDAINFDLLKKALEIIYSENKDIYLNLMEGLINELEFEVMENAYTFRQDRLSYYGFPEKENAIKIYSKLSKKELASKEHKELSFLEEPLELERKEIPNYLKLCDKERLFLDELWLALGEEKKEVIEHIQLELVWITNKVIVCRGIELFDEQSAQQSLAQVKNYLNIGLEDLSHKNLQKALKLIKTFWLEDIFRWGFTQILTLREKAEKTAKTYRKFCNGSSHLLENFYSFLEQGYAQTWKGILKQHPKIYDKDLNGYRYFKNQIDLEQVAQAIQEIHLALELMGRKEFKNFKELLQPKNLNIFRTDIKLSSFIITLFANFTLHDTLQIKPLSISELSTFLNKIFVKGKIAKDLKIKFFEAVNTNKPIFRNLSDNILNEYEKELLLLKNKPSKEPYLYSSVMLLSSED